METLVAIAVAAIRHIHQRQKQVSHLVRWVLRCREPQRSRVFAQTFALGNSSALLVVFVAAVAVVVVAAAIVVGSVESLVLLS